MTGSVIFDSITFGSVIFGSVTFDSIGKCLCILMYTSLYVVDNYVISNCKVNLRIS